METICCPLCETTPCVCLCDVIELIKKPTILWDKTIRCRQDELYLYETVMSYVYKYGDKVKVTVERME